MLEAGYYSPLSYFGVALLALALAVLSLIVFTFLNRYLYERRRTRRENEGRRVQEAFERLCKTRDPEEEHRIIAETMRGVGGPARAAFIGLIDGAQEAPRRPEWLCQAARYGGQERLSRRAVSSPFRWRRIEAIEELEALPHPEVLDTLARCLRDDDEDVAYAAMRALARRKELYAAELLLSLFGTEDANPKRAVTMLEQFESPIEELVWPRLRDRDPEVRTWAATVLEVSGDAGSVERLLKSARDPDPDVRSASIRSLARIGDARGAAVLPEALDDEVWFVRASAARLAGELRTVGLFDRVVRLLGDKNWWVRQNAKAALIVLCPEVEEGLEPYLLEEDRFVRNMVAEVLDACGAVQRRARELETDPASPGARRFFERLIVAEGRGSVEGLARTASPGPRGVLLELLENETSRAS